MQKKLLKYLSVARLGGIVVIAALLAFIGYQLYDFYRERIGLTPVRAIETYFGALSKGEFGAVYQLTAKENLTDIYGRPITEGEFIEQLENLTGGHRLPFRMVEATKLFDRSGLRYYLVTLQSSLGGAPGTSRVLVEVRRENDTWVLTYPFAIVL